MTHIFSGHSFSYEMECITRLFLPDCKISSVEGETFMCEGDAVLTLIQSQPDGEHITVSLRLGEVQSTQTEVISEQSRQYAIAAGVDDLSKICQRAMGVLLYRQLAAATGKQPEWGVLIGIRPVKLFGDRMEHGMSPEDTERFYVEQCLVSESKARLAVLTAQKERLILSRNTPDSFSLYISIPFCPTRCNYCSFVSHSIEKVNTLIPEYVERLCCELERTGEIAAQLGLRLRTVYFGGGTPTTLTAEQLTRLTGTVARCFDLSAIEEYTVEAGRPDTITPEKLSVLKAAGVTRISINPQTMNDDVLCEIGRKHTAQQTVDAFRLARSSGFDNINMDVIAGLSTETLESFQNTIDRILTLSPENITVHTLAVKKAAQLAESTAEVLTGGQGLVCAMVRDSQEKILAAGYQPYYLYKQKNTVDNLENVGYTKPGREGLYNVWIMDETHSIFAVGAGATTKLREPAGAQIKRVFNYKFPYEYISRFDEILRRKEQILDFYEKYGTALK